MGTAANGEIEFLLSFTPMATNANYPPDYTLKLSTWQSRQTKKQILRYLFQNLAHFEKRRFALPCLPCSAKERGEIYW